MPVTVDIIGLMLASSLMSDLMGRGRKPAASLQVLFKAIPLESLNVFLMFVVDHGHANGHAWLSCERGPILAVQQRS